MEREEREGAKKIWTRRILIIESGVWISCGLSTADWRKSVVYSKSKSLILIDEADSIGDRLEGDEERMDETRAK